MYVGATDLTTSIWIPSTPVCGLKACLRGFGTCRCGVRQEDSKQPFLGGEKWAFNLQFGHAPTHALDWQGATLIDTFLVRRLEQCAFVCMYATFGSRLLESRIEIKVIP